MNNQQEARIILSKEIIKWQDSKNNILLSLITGVGKTYNSLNIIRHKNIGKKGLILVPEIALIKNFRDDAIKHGFNDLVEESTIACYASLSKFENEEYDWVILDECHRAKSDIRIESLLTIKAPVIIGLSATVNDEVEEILNKVRKFDKFTIDITEAIERGLVPQPEVHIIYLELDDKVVRNTFKYGKREVKCTDAGYYQRISDSITYWKDLYEDEGKQFQKLKMLSEGSTRSRFLGELKTQKVSELIDSLEGERMIVFCSSVKQANKLGGKKVASAEKTKKENAEIVEKFNNQEVDKIYCKSMLKEGINLSNCRYGIITQLNNQEKDFTQQVGRCLRHNSPQVFIFVFRDTVDERFLRNSTTKMDDSYLTYH